MKKLFKLIKFVFLLAFVFGGWALAAASLHVVRAPGRALWNSVPLNVQLIPKNRLTFKNPYIDTTKWSMADVAAHPVFVERLRQAGKLNLIEQAMKTPARPAAETTSEVSTDAPSHAAAQGAAETPAAKPGDGAADRAAQGDPAAGDEAKPREKSIFDFGK